MHIDSKSTDSINQATYKMNDNILESKLELKDLGIVVDKPSKFYLFIFIYLLYLTLVYKIVKNNSTNKYQQDQVKT